MALKGRFAYKGKSIDSVIIDEVGIEGTFVNMALTDSVVPVPKRGKGSQAEADRAAAARILKTPVDKHDLFDQHIQALIKEGRSLGRHVRVDIAPMTQWSEQDDPILDPSRVQAMLTVGLISRQTARVQLGTEPEGPLRVKVGGMVMVSTAGSNGHSLWAEESSVPRTT